MTSVVMSPCDRNKHMSDTTSKSSFLVERYYSLLNSLNEDNTDSNDTMMGLDQEVPLSTFCDSSIKAKAATSTVSEPSMLCDLTSYLPSDSFILGTHHQNNQQHNHNNNNNNMTLTVGYDNRNTINTNTLGTDGDVSSTTIDCLGNIPTSVYVMDEEDSCSNTNNTLAPKSLSFTDLSQTQFPFSSNHTNLFSSSSSQPIPYSSTNFVMPLSTSSVSSLSSSLSSSTPSIPSQMSFNSSLSRSSHSPSPSPAYSDNIDQQQLAAKSKTSSVPASLTSSSLSSMSSSPSSLSPCPMNISSYSPVPSYSSSYSASLSSLSSSPSPLLSSSPRAFSESKAKTFISELGGSGCTMSEVPNFLRLNVTDMAPGRNTMEVEESLEYTDLDKLDEEFSSVGDQKVTSSLSEMKSMEEMVDLMREAIEHDRSTLSLPQDPHMWNSAETAKWIKWVCQRSNVPDISDQLSNANGSTLCSMDSQTFKSLYGQSGYKVYEELDLWRTVNSYNTPSDLYDSEISSTTVHDPFVHDSSPYPSSTPSVSPVPSHLSNASYDTRAFHTSLDNSEDEVFYPESDVKVKSEVKREVHTSTFDQLPKQAFKPRMGRGHKKAITLWQFLLQLLIGGEDHSDCIRWLNQEARIFKIEDSKKVAAMWGKVKSRPAMNYDKLSRSVRQYYKKGIIKKPTQTKRLVYQFCPGIC